MPRRKKRKLLRSELYMLEHGIREENSKTLVPEDLFYELCDLAEKRNEDPEYDKLPCPTIADMKRFDVEQHPGKYLPFLLYLDIHESWEPWCAETRQYVNRILKEKIELI